MAAGTSQHLESPFEASPHSRSQSQVSPIERFLKSPLGFALLTTLLSFLYEWPKRWLVSGAPLLQFLVLVGEYQGCRVLPNINLWPLFATLNLIYSICSTSWLLYGAFTATCYGAVGVVSLCQFDVVGDRVRRSARGLLKQLHFIDDKIALFEIPALEIDTDVDGLMVLRGITFSLSTLSFVVHGVEVGIKLSDDMELAIQSQHVKVKLFRGIEIGDCFANLKGGAYEMTFGEIGDKTEDADGDQVFVVDTPLLKAASRDGDRRSMDSVRSGHGNGTIKMTDKMTNGSIPEDSTAMEGLENMEKLHPEDDEHNSRYKEMIDFLRDTNTIHEAREHVKKAARKVEKDEQAEKTFDQDAENAIRAAICSQMHNKPSVPHPPQRSIKVTTLQQLAPPYVRKFLHRLPMLLRLLLNPLSYFHPVHIASITATASGSWVETMLMEKIFKDYASSDREISALQSRIKAWLSDANFAVELGAITGLAQVPFVPTYDIVCELAFEDVMAYRTLPARTDLKQVVRLGGADARFRVPSFLLPHHEHILPPVPSESRKNSLSRGVDEADGKPKEIQAEHALEQAEKDETNAKISVHARLPACFDQELLDFVAALVKATKVVELEKAESVMDEEVHGLRDFARYVTVILQLSSEATSSKHSNSQLSPRGILLLIGRIGQ